MIGSAKRMGLSQFLGHSTRAGGKKSFLTNWHSQKNCRPTPKGRMADIDVLLNAAAGITAIWQHGFQRNVSMERSENGVQVTKWEVWGETYNCLESEDILTRQFFYDDKGRREAPPQVCPMCLMLEHIGWSVESGELDWCAPVFKFAPPGAEEVVLYAGGLTGQFGNRNLTEEDKAQIKAKTGVTQRFAFKQDSTASCKYVFCVADVSSLEKGIQITTETKALGMAVQALIEDQQKGMNEAGNPFKHPYVIRWEYWPDANQNDRYKAIAMRTIPITPEMRALVDAPAPRALEKALEYPNMLTLRASLERVCLIPMPWDQIFAPVMEHCDEQGNLKVDDSSNGASAPAEREEEPPPVTGPVQGSLVDSNVETAPCDRCRQPFPTSATQCPSCGMVYEVETLPDATTPAAAATPPWTEPAAAHPPAAAAAPPPAPPPPPVQSAPVPPADPMALPPPHIPTTPTARGRSRARGTKPSF